MFSFAQPFPRKSLAETLDGCLFASFVSLVETRSDFTTSRRWLFANSFCLSIFFKFIDSRDLEIDLIAGRFLDAVGGKLSNKCLFSPFNCFEDVFVKFRSPRILRCILFVSLTTPRRRTSSPRLPADSNLCSNSRYRRFACHFSFCLFPKADPDPLVDRRFWSVRVAVVQALRVRSNRNSSAATTELQQ